jgi:hypothetical protein
VAVVPAACVFFSIFVIRINAKQRRAAFHVVMSAGSDLKIFLYVVVGIALVEISVSKTLIIDDLSREAICKVAET